MSSDTIWNTTALQRALLAREHLAIEEGREDSSDYLGQAVIEFSAFISPQRVESALHRILRVAPQLRAGFLLDAHIEPTQFIEEYDEHAPVLESLSVASQEHDGQLERARRAQLSSPFALDDPPLIRWLLITSEDRSSLLITAHHAIMDAWSMNLLVEHLARALSAPAQPQLPVADYAEHLELLRLSDTAAAQDFWREHLAHLPDLQRPSWLRQGNVAGEGRVVELSLTKEQTQALMRAARENSLTPASVLRGSFALALDWVSGQRATPFVTPVHGRDPRVPFVENTLGLFTDSVLFSSNAQPSGIAETLRDFQEQWQSSEPHHHVGLLGIINALSLRDPSHVLLSIERRDDDARAKILPEGTELWLAQVEDSSHYPLQVTAQVPSSRSSRAPGTPGEACDEVIVLKVEADGRVAQLLPERLVHAMHTLLEAFAQTPHRQVSQIDLRTENDRALVSKQTTGRRTAGRPESQRAPLSLQESWQEALAAHPSRRTLVTSSATLTFTQLNEQIQSRIAMLSDAAKEAGASECLRGYLLVLDMPRGPEALQWLLASLFSGATTLVLNHAMPSESRDEILQGLGPCVLIREEGFICPSQGLTAVFDVDAAPFLLVLTSGSTGMPKPVAVTERAMSLVLEHHREHLWPGDGLQLAHTNALHFDAHWDSLLGIFAGHTVHLIDEQDVLDSVELSRILRDKEIDYLDLGPALWAAHLSSGELGALPPVCVAGGEAFPPDLWAKMRCLSQEQGVRVINMYGPTENTIDALWAHVNESAEPVVGSPLGGSECVILDELLRPLPPGSVGELYLAGDQLAQGYWKMSAVTASRFIAAHSLVSSSPGDRLYRTGDLARYDEQGRVLLLGRSDDQISINGFRIEPGEISSVLTRLEGVSQAHVASLEHPHGGRRLLAWVLSKREGEDIRAELSGVLAPHMLPVMILTLDRFPLTSNSKIDVQRLPVPSWARSESSDDAGVLRPGALSCEEDAPSVPLKALLRQASLLLGEVKAEDSVLLAGGDSIFALRICAGLRQGKYPGLESEEQGSVLHQDTHRSGGYFLSAGTLLAAASFQEAAEFMTELVDEETETTGPLEIPAQIRANVEDPANIEDVLPLTGTQLGMFLESSKSSRDPFRTSTRFQIKAVHDFSQTHLDHVISRVLQAHPALRTIFVQGEQEEANGVVLSTPSPCPSQVIDARGFSEEEQSEAFAQAKERSLDGQHLETNRLIVPVWVVTGQESAELFLGIHHLLADGWSTGLIARSLKRAFDEHEVPEEGGWRRYAQWFAAQDPQAWAKKWGEILCPEARGMLAQHSDPTQEKTHVLCAWKTPLHGSPLGQALSASSRTLATLTQAAWARTLSTLTGSPEVIYALTSSGRDLPVDGLEDAVGSFITTRPVNVDASQSSPELLDKISEQVRETELPAHLGVAGIRQATGIEYDTLVVVENYPRFPDDPHHGAQVLAVDGEDRSGFAITLTLGMRGEEIECEIELDLPGALPHWGREILAHFLNHFHSLIALRPDHTTAELIEQGFGQSDPQAPWKLNSQRNAQASPPASLASSSGNTHGSEISDSETELVATIVDAFEESLGRKLESTEDFFLAGGDSILAMRAVGLLRRRGVSAKISDIFSARNAQNLGVLPSVERVKTQEFLTIDQTEKGPSVSGAGSSCPNASSVPLTPALRWYVKHIGQSKDPFVQVRTLRIPEKTRDEDLRRALSQLVLRHESLRLRLHGPSLTLGPGYDPFLVVGQSLYTQDPLPHIRQASRALDPEQGRLCVALRTQPQRLVIVAHHLGVDAISWPTLIDDLRALCVGEPLASPVSYREAAISEEQAAKALGPRKAGVRSLLKNIKDQASSSSGNPERISVPKAPSVQVPLSKTWKTSTSLTLTASSSLLAASSERRIDVLIASAISYALNRASVIEFEGHGRPIHHVDDHRAHIDWSAVVGWWTKTWSLPMAAPGLCSPQEHLLACSTLAHSVHHFSEDICLGALDADLGPADALINYLGEEGNQTHHMWDNAESSSALEELLGLGQSLKASHPVEINAGVQDRALVLHWQFVPAWLPYAEQMMGQVHEFLESVASDLPDHHEIVDLVGLPAADLAGFAASGVDAVWPLTPAQHGIALQSIGSQRDHYVSSTDLCLEGPLDLELLERCVKRLAQENPQLRLRLAECGNKYLLLSLREDAPSFKVFSSSYEANSWLERPFNLEEEPLLRWAVVQDQERFTLLMRDHHLVIDGWSVPLVIQALFRLYRDHLERPTSLPALALSDLSQSPYAHFSLVAMQRHDDDWLTALSPAQGELFSSWSGEHAQVELSFDAKLTLKASRKHALSPSEALVVAWGHCLSALSAQEHLTLGSVVSGRDASNDRLIGMLLGTVPLSLNAADLPLSKALECTRKTSRLALENPWPPLTDLARAAGRTVLFDTLIVVENYPQEHDGQLAPGLKIHEIQGHDDTHYPLSLTAETHEGLLRLDYPSDLLEPSDAESILQAVLGALKELASCAPAALASQLTQAAQSALSARALELCRLSAENLSQAQTQGLEGQEPESELVELVLQALEKTLGHRPAAEENFFALGGDSVMSMSIITFLKRRGFSLSSRDLFAAPTAKGMACRLKKSVPITEEHAPVALSQDSVDRGALDNLLQGLGR